jgi:predicted aldo/keto reductase-like oxidoreductase
MSHSRWSRRAFLGRIPAQAGAIALGLTGCKRDALAGDEAEPIDPKTISVKKRPLGRTGLQISEIGFGSFPVDNPSVVDHAIDIGINYIDTAPDYRDGRSERTVGKVMARRRKEVVLTTKWHPGPETKRAEMLASLDGSLKRLRTDHVDVILVHSVADVRRLQNPELLEAFRVAKEQGKVSHLGVSSHSPTLIPVMDYAIDSGHFDVLLCKYNFLDYPKAPALFEKASKAGVGVIAMKTLGGAKHVDLAAFRETKGTFARAALKWVLSNSHVSGLVISMSGFEHVRDYAAASGRKLTSVDGALLRRYADLTAGTVCRGCEDCHGACPAGVPVADVLRYAMYHDQYGQRGQARALYGRLPGATAAACVGCDAPCESSCFHGLPIRRQNLAAHAALA